MQNNPTNTTLVVPPLCGGGLLCRGPSNPVRRNTTPVLEAFEGPRDQPGAFSIHYFIRQKRGTSWTIGSKSKAGCAVTTSSKPHAAAG